MKSFFLSLFLTDAPEIDESSIPMPLDEYSNLNDQEFAPIHAEHLRTLQSLASGRLGRDLSVVSLPWLFHLAQTSDFEDIFQGRLERFVRLALSNRETAESMHISTFLRQRSKIFSLYNNIADIPAALSSENNHHYQSPRQQHKRQMIDNYLQEYALMLEQGEKVKGALTILKLIDFVRQRMEEFEMERARMNRFQRESRIKGSMSTPGA